MSAFSKYFILVAFICTFVYSCKPDDPVDPVPVDPRDKITGSWKCDEVSEVGGSQTFTVNISNHSSDSTKIWIENIYGLSTSTNKVSAYAILSNTTLSISIQTVVNDTYIINGNGTISSNFKTINFSYQVNDGSGDLDNVTAVYTKQ